MASRVCRSARSTRSTGTWVGSPVVGSTSGRTHTGVTPASTMPSSSERCSVRVTTTASPGRHSASISVWLPCVDPPTEMRPQSAPHARASCGRPRRWRLRSDGSCRRRRTAECRRARRVRPGRCAACGREYRTGLHRSRGRTATRRAAEHRRRRSSGSSPSRRDWSGLVMPPTLVTPTLRSWLRWWSSAQAWAAWPSPPGCPHRDTTSPSSSSRTAPAERSRPTDATASHSTPARRC